MKMTHFLTMALLAVGALYVFHMFTTHGTGKQALAGIGIGK